MTERDRERELQRERDRVAERERYCKIQSDIYILGGIKSKA